MYPVVNETLAIDPLFNATDRVLVDTGLNAAPLLQNTPAVVITLPRVAVPASTTPAGTLVHAFMLELY